MSVSRKTRFAVLRRDRFTCVYCGAKAPNVALHVDHRLAIARGGSDDPINLVTACEDCNHGKGADAVTSVAADAATRRAMAGPDTFASRAVKEMDATLRAHRKGAA